MENFQEIKDKVKALETDVIDMKIMFAENNLVTKQNLESTKELSETLKTITSTMCEITNTLKSQGEKQDDTDKDIKGLKKGLKEVEDKPKIDTTVLLKNNITKLLGFGSIGAFVAWVLTQIK